MRLCCVVWFGMVLLWFALFSSGVLCCVVFGVVVRLFDVCCVVRLWCCDDVCVRFSLNCSFCSLFSCCVM